MTGDKNIFFLLCNILAKYETTVIIWIHIVQGTNKSGSF
jgi:hypothetical protein